MRRPSILFEFGVGLSLPTKEQNEDSPETSYPLSSARTLGLMELITGRLEAGCDARQGSHPSRYRPLSSPQLCPTSYQLFSGPNSEKLLP